MSLEKRPPAADPPRLGQDRYRHRKYAVGRCLQDPAVPDDATFVLEHPQLRAAFSLDDLAELTAREDIETAL